MRNFEERIAEIGRRSEKILRQRRQRRRHILTACVPMVLGITACLFWWYSPNRTAPLEQIPDVPDTAAGETYFSYACSVDRIDVSGPGISRTLTEPAEIEKVTGYLQKCNVTVVQIQSATGKVPDSDMTGETATEIFDTTTRGDSIPNGATSDSVDAGYTVTFALSGEEPVQYHLLEDTIQNCATGEIYTLTQTQARVLHHILGIPNP